MKAIFTLLLIVVASGVASASDSAITKVLSSMDWQNAPLDLVDPNTDPPLRVIIEFEKEGTWKKQEDEWGIRPRRSSADGGLAGSFYLFGKGWGDSHGKSGSGEARPGNFSKEGFDVVFSLRWSLKSGEQWEFKETFPCKWVPVQTFEKDGFRIAVVVKAD